MKYQVVLQRAAVRDLDSLYLWAARHAPVSATSWRDRLFRKLQTLNQNPQRCGIAYEAKKVGYEIRQLLFGRRPSTYRILFFIDGQVVRVLRIRRAQQRYLTGREIDEAKDADS